MTQLATSVLVLHNIPLAVTPGSNQESDAGILQEVEAVCQALQQLGYAHRRVGIGSLGDLRRCLSASLEPIVLNLVEYLQPGVQDASLVPTICRAFGKSCTGNDSLALMLGLDKWRAKALFQYAGLCIPRGVLVPVGIVIDLATLPPGPFIVKPVATDASEGIDDKALVQHPDTELIAAVRRVHECFNQAALIEQFVGQRELNISLLQTGSDMAVLPLAEIDFSELGERPHIVGYAAKWQVDSYEYSHTPRILPAPLAEEVAERVRRAALSAWKAVDCQDYARVDMRLDQDGTPWVLEVNPNPDISLDAGYVAALMAAGISYERFVDTLVKNAWDRYRQEHPAPPPTNTEELVQPRQFRPTCPEDRPVIKGMLERSGFFREDEVLIALEVLDDALEQDIPAGYASYVIEEQNAVLGWICWGPTPCTIGTYDIYWMVVEPTRCAAGLGTALLDYAEGQIRANQGRLSVIETSGNAQYYPTRQFYLRRGYQEAARLPDFYAPGDDKVIYTKVLR
ncbi:MAG: GNAT family N-acetyltransferase [Anaerolineae bacterium]